MPATEMGTLINEVRELKNWIRAMAITQVAASIKQVAQSESDLRIYENLDGSRTQSEVAKLSGVTQSTVSRFVSRLKPLGLVVVSEAGKDLHLVSPAALGLLGAE